MVLELVSHVLNSLKAENPFAGSAAINSNTVIIIYLFILLSLLIILYWEILACICYLKIELK